ncbi:MAG TPA: hypothetical protein P5137_12075, partial [Candidatus Brocadiia bacterium]|nr:hypothetical protein [Candidatus Brocadiia bacterium]
YVWFRIKGDKLKPAVFCWVTLGESEYYCRMYTSGRLQPEWGWVRALAIKSVANPDEKPALFEVKTSPTALKIRHRANYFAVDEVFITNAVWGNPVPGAFGPHPGCGDAFGRK